MTNYKSMTRGSLALSTYERSHMRLVYDSRFDDERNMRNTRKRRARGGIAPLGALVVTVLLFLTISVISSSVRHSRVSETLDAAPVTRVYVREGDTLWSVAERQGISNVDTSDVVRWMKSHNGLDSSALHPGQTLIAPVAG